MFSFKKGRAGDNGLRAGLSADLLGSKNGRVLRKSVARWSAEVPIAAGPRSQLLQSQAGRRVRHSSIHHHSQSTLFL